ncbi:MAG: hypothetical protein Q8O04_04250 [Deltaproteobacteria bacterium]|nr:hypothetical protein [Deltaproteobacteria bacterium]
MRLTIDRNSGGHVILSRATTCTFRYFVQKVLEEAEERDVRQLKIRKTGMGISDIIVEECDKFQVSATLSSPFCKFPSGPYRRWFARFLN